MPALQDAFVHATGFHRCGVFLVVPVFIVTDGLDHSMLNGRFSFRRRSNLCEIEIERLRPVPFARDDKFPLYTGGDYA